MAKHIVLSDGEWKLMKLLWENHPMTLGDMVEAMQDDTAWSKGTIFTMLRRMSTKGVIRMDDSAAKGGSRTGRDAKLFGTCI